MPQWLPDIGHPPSFNLSWRSWGLGLGGPPWSPCLCLHPILCPEWRHDLGWLCALEVTQQGTPTAEPTLLCPVSAFSKGGHLLSLLRGPEGRLLPLWNLGVNRELSLKRL